MPRTEEPATMPTAKALGVAVTHHFGHSDLGEDGRRRNRNAGDRGEDGIGTNRADTQATL